jgi:hypothetical protein
MQRIVPLNWPESKLTRSSASQNDTITSVLHLTVRNESLMKEPFPMPRLQTNQRPEQRQDQQNVDDYSVESPSFPWLSRLFPSRKPPMKPTILVLSALSYLFATLQLSHCSFMHTGLPGSEVAMGLFSTTAYDKNGASIGCLAYTDQIQMDGMFRAGRAFGTITALWTGTAFLLLLVALTFCPPRTEKLWNIARGLLTTATITQMFTFFVMGSEQCPTNDCFLSGVGVLAVFNTFVLLGVSSMTYLEAIPVEPWLVLSNDDCDVAHNDTSVTPIAQEECVPHASCSTTGISSNPANLLDTVLPNPEVLEMKDVDLNDKHDEPSDADPSSSDASVQSHDPAENVAHERDTFISTIGTHHRNKLRLLSFGLVLAAWSISLVGIQRCTFILVGLRETGKSNYSGLGLFSRAVYYNGEILGCVAYPDEVRGDFDSVFQASRAFGVFTVLLLTTVTILFCLQLFTNKAKSPVWLAVRVLLTCAVITQLLVFLVFKSDTCSINNMVECVPGGAGIMVVLNLFLILTLAVYTNKMEPPRNPVFLSWRNNNHEALLPVGQKLPIRSEELRQLPDGGTETEESGHIGDCANEARFPDVSEKQYNSDNAGPSKNENKEDALDDVDMVKVQVKYTATEKTIVKEVTHTDGSKTITTTIEELDIACNDDNGSKHNQRATIALASFPLSSEKSAVQESAQLLPENKCIHHEGCPTHFSTKSNTEWTCKNHSNHSLQLTLGKKTSKHLAEQKNAHMEEIDKYINQNS